MIQFFKKNPPGDFYAAVVQSRKLQEMLMIVEQEVMWPKMLLIYSACHEEYQLLRFEIAVIHYVTNDKHEIVNFYWS